jgi:uncharacterized protein DUF3883
MACDYSAIRRDNERRYGTDIGRIGPMLLADRYDDRAHFIFELLQNAEDALARRHGWQGARAVSFFLSAHELSVSHFGKPFDESNVRGICGIGESTKELTAIGRFGIGFKSVYAFTDRPEVHSGEENFAIESFVWPTAVTRRERQIDETIFALPLRPKDATAFLEIQQGLQRLGSRTLLFLRQIEEIAWTVEGGASGLYLRSKPETLGEAIRRINLVGETDGRPDGEESWLVFSRDVKTQEGKHAGYVEIAFSIGLDKEPAANSIQAVADSPLVVYFPTVRPTHLGFLVQGPYRTTPSRDNVPPSDPWNQNLVRETATLLLEALRWLRDRKWLNAVTLQCLPLDRIRFSENNMFALLFKAVRDALTSEPLLPGYDGNYVSSSKAKLARTQELRDLFNPSQLGQLFGLAGQLAWLTADISQDRTPELRQYLLRELDITEVTPDVIPLRLSRGFLTVQSDEWMLRLYEFLNGQSALIRQGRLHDLPLVRLENGAHVSAMAHGQPQAFLPSTIETGFPIVRPSVCCTEGARQFLRLLGLTEPDPVDDVVRNVLGRYSVGSVDMDSKNYAEDISRIVRAFSTDSKMQREKLIAALRDAPFVMSVDAGRGSEMRSRPLDVYVATERLKDLFSGVAGVLLVDDSHACLRGEDIREVLEACGAARYLLPVSASARFTWQELTNMRQSVGHANYSRDEIPEDLTLRGLKKFLETLPKLDAETRKNKASLLWQALGDVVDRRGTGTFSGTYRWAYYRNWYSVPFDVAFVRLLNGSAWVPDANGELDSPEFVIFDTLGWKPNPFLSSKIRFKPPIIETLAREAGIEPGVLDLLKKLGVTSEAELRDRLGLKDEPTTTAKSPDTVEDTLKSRGHAHVLTPPASDPIGPEPPASGDEGDRGAGDVAGAGVGSGDEAGASGGGQNARRTNTLGSDAGKRTPGSGGGRSFISYLRVLPGEEEPDPDGLNQAARMALEARAIDLILSREPHWHRTPTHNPGYDLYQADETGKPTHWCEVKAMTGCLADRPVGLSRTQFECAQSHGEAYWLYIVEHAGGDGERIVRIHDLAGKAQTFTFDRGWLGVAFIDSDEST